ncbi:MAG: DUF1501 domain-containing protein [Myxococcota bacterium]
MNRRNFLHGLNASALTAATMSGVGTALSSFSAQAATGDGYRALVCVFLGGGMDNYDTVIPYDTASNARWSEIRQSLLGSYPTSRRRSNLLPLNPTNAGGFGGRSFALPQELSGIAGLFESGDAAIAGNVGPLIQPVDRTGFEAQSVRLPPRLFSHNDQQSVWMANSPEGAQYGWGGLFADAAFAANRSSEFSVITSGGNELFITGRQAVPYQISTGGAAEIYALGDFAELGLPDLSSRLRRIFRGEIANGSNLIERDVKAAMTNAFDSNERFNAALRGLAALATEFPATGVGEQLGAVARSIALRQPLEVNRQVFIIDAGGYDTHDRQAQDIPRLQAELDGAVVAFQQAMGELGTSNDVTLFTASDFGRSLAVNGDGTDHGWGAHHFVIGGAVAGQAIYGDLPVSDFGHALDAGGGRLIPTTSVDQYAAPLGRWFGLNDTELADALPNLANFTADPLRFL